MTGLVRSAPRDAALAALARYVVGDGIELGPGHQPFPLPYPASNVRYVDRWKPDQNQQLFPELGHDVVFPVPDIIADLNVEGLSMLPDGSEDFVIASHLLEHLVDPLAQISEIHRVLKPGGIALIVLPDRRFTFDRARRATTLEHLVDDHEAGLQIPDDAHIEEFLIYTEGWNSERDADKREATFEAHRQRSFHVHCWTQEEFLPVLRYSMTDMHLSWELLDVLFVDEIFDGIEYGFVLRRSLRAIDPELLAARLDDVWSTLVERHEAAKQRARTPEPESAPQQRPFVEVAYRAIRYYLRPLKRWSRALLRRPPIEEVAQQPR